MIRDPVLGARAGARGYLCALPSPALFTFHLARGGETPEAGSPSLRM